MKGSKWARHLAFIYQNRDAMDTEEIASAIGTTRNNLHKICMREGITLPRKNYKTQKSIKGTTFFRTSNHAGYTKESATAFLNAMGYRVVFDPFMMPENRIEGFDKTESERIFDLVE